MARGEKMAEEIIDRGLQEARELRYCNKKPSRDSEALMTRAIESLNKKEWRYPSHKRMCKQKLVEGLNVLIQRKKEIQVEKENQTEQEPKSEDAPKSEPEVTYVRKRGRKKKAEQTLLQI